MELPKNRKKHKDVITHYCTHLKELISVNLLCIKTISCDKCKTKLLKDYEK